MKQVRHYLRNGALDIGEVPMPALGAGEVLVRNVQRSMAERRIVRIEARFPFAIS
jgi:hypothetical protein